MKSAIIIVISVIHIFGGSNAPNVVKRTNCSPRKFADSIAYDNAGSVRIIRGVVAYFR